MRNNRWTTGLSHDGPQIVYASIFQSNFMRRFHFWSLVGSYRNKKLSPEGKSKNQFLKPISRLHRDMMYLRIDSESAQSDVDMEILWSLLILRVTGHWILILVKIMCLLFANSTTGFGINRPNIRIHRVRKYPNSLESNHSFVPMCSLLAIKPLRTLQSTILECFYHRFVRSWS